MCDVNTKEKTNGTRLRRLLLDGGTQVLRRLFDSIHSNSALPGVLKANEADLRRICRFDDQIELLFPLDGGQPDSKTFDITLLALLLSNICGLTEPPTRWNRQPSSSDKTKEANIVRIRLFRNKIQHFPGSGIDDKEFEALWNELSEPLKDLGLSQDEINNLKATPIDDNSEIQERWQKLCKHEQRIEDLEKTVNEQGNQIKEIKEELQDRKKHETIKSCIPDKPSSFIGRKEELSEIIHAKTIDKKPFVLVHGMAGIGKSTLVKKASWDLVHIHKQNVYFVDLCRCKATEEDISKTINYKLYHGTKVENKPREALNIWARNLDQSVILALDNAEDVLSAQQTGDDGNGGMSCFVKILLEIREFSSQKVDYLIASREVLSFDVDVSRKEINLKPFKENDSLEFINLILSEEPNADSSELTNIHKQEFVKLCSNIPLALRIVIPMLDDYSPDELVKKLRSKPLAVLEPLKRALSLSFEKLDDTLLDHLLKLTIFSGSFAADSAAEIIGSGRERKDDVVKLLKKLYAKSLLQRENKKYSFHPFIHKFVVDYGENKAKQHLLEEGKFNFLSHYQSLLLQNTKLYWTKDSCGQSLSAFNEDRVNFEKALEILLRDPVLDLTRLRMENTMKIVEELTYVLMYLESCTSWDLLGRLLDKFITLTKNNNLPSRELESLCWKGHIARRRGDEEEYERLVKQADELYDRIVADKQSGVQIDDTAEICYKSAKGRYLGGHKKDYDQGDKIFEEIRKFCKKMVFDDPSWNENYARAIVELGHISKHKGEFKKAVENYKQASAIYEKHLGQHTKTALSFKDIADGHLKQDTPDHIEQALEYYNKAIDMLTNLKSDSETHMILLLKNTGVCYRKLKKYCESEDHFKKALSIAENKLKENHKYKCLVKEELAYLYDDMKDREKLARSVAEEASKMANKMNLKAGDCFRDEERLQRILSYSQP